MTHIAHLESRALIKIDGSEAQNFLQNLVTCDIDGLGEDGLTFGGLLTPQGKVLFDFFIQKQNDGFFIDIAENQRDAIIKRLTFYKLRADVSIATDEQRVFGIWPTFEGQPPLDPRLDGLGARVYTSEMGTNATEGEWHQNRIALGVPHSGLDFDFGDVFPHDVLMDQFEKSGVDFSKGCYVGQEVVSRMQHRSTARNRFVLVSTPSGSLPPKDTEILAGEKTIGKMGFSLGSKGLALVRVDRVTKAVESGQTLVAGETVVILTKPSFAAFEWAS